MYIYTREIQFQAPANGFACVELPANTSGSLDKIAIVSLDASRQETSFRIFTRKGACRNAFDLNTPGGDVDNTGFANSDDYPGLALLQVPGKVEIAGGDVLWIKDTAIPEINVDIEVLDVVFFDAVYDGDELDTPASTAIVLDVPFTTVENDLQPGGIWQLKPRVPEFQINTPQLYMLLGVNTIPSDTGILRLNNISASYENRDNQGIHDRRRKTALYMEFDLGDGPGQSETNWAISITTIDELGD